MKVRELRGKTTQELNDILLELLREHFNLRMQKGTGQLTRPSQMRSARKDVARIKTMLNEKKAG